MLWMDQCLHLPDQMNMIDHDDERIEGDTLIFYEKAETIGDDIFILIRF